MLFAMLHDGCLVSRTAENTKALRIAEWMNEVFSPLTIDWHEWRDENCREMRENERNFQREWNRFIICLANINKVSQFLQLFWRK